MIVMVAAVLCWIVDVYLLTQRSLTAAVVVVVVLPNISDVYYLQSGRKQEEEEPSCSDDIISFILCPRPEESKFCFPNRDEDDVKSIILIYTDRWI